MKIQLAADLQIDSIVDGEGIRTVIWTQGCPHHCPGCHNPETHDFNSGASIELDYVKEKISNLKNQDGITFSGGDPFVQPKACAEIAKFAKSKDLNIWCYTGYLFENLLKMSHANEDIANFLTYIDVLVDGKFEIGKKSLSTAYRGSTNQRIIDVQESLKHKKTILVEKYIKKEESVSRKKEGIFV